MLRPGVKKLRKFLEDNGIPKRSAAKAVGVSHVTFMAWLKGKLTPGETNQIAIETWTSKKIVRADWLTEGQKKKMSQVVPFAAKGAA